MSWLVTLAHPRLSWHYATRYAYQTRCCKGLLFYGGLHRSAGLEPQCIGVKSLLQNVEVVEEIGGELASTRYELRVFLSLRLGFLAHPVFLSFFLAFSA